MTSLTVLAIIVVFNLCHGTSAITSNGSGIKLSSILVMNDTGFGNNNIITPTIDNLVANANGTRLVIAVIICILLSIAWYQSYKKRQYSLRITPYIHNPLVIAIAIGKYDSDKRKDGEDDEKKKDDQTNNMKQDPNDLTKQQLWNIIQQQQNMISQKEYMIQQQSILIQRLLMDKHLLTFSNKVLLQNSCVNQSLLSLSVQTMQDINNLTQENQKLRSIMIQKTRTSQYINGKRMPNKQQLSIKSNQNNHSVQGRTAKAKAAALVKTSKTAAVALLPPKISYVLDKNKVFIKITRELVQRLKDATNGNFENIKCGIDHKRKQCKCDGLDLYLRNLIAIQFNNDQYKLNNNKSNIINSGLEHHESKQDIYLMVDNESKNEERAEFIMRDELFDKNTIVTKYSIEPPNRIRDGIIFHEGLNQQEMIKQYLMDSAKYQQLLNKSKWNKLPIFTKIDNNRRKTLSIRKPEFVNDLQSTKMDELHLIPILMFAKNKFEIHHVMIVEIDNGINIGISLIYNKETKQVEATGIHIDKISLYRQHQWISLKHMDECKCFDNFSSSINDLTIGNPDYWKNKYNDMSSRKNNLESQINRLKSKCNSRSPPLSSFGDYNNEMADSSSSYRSS